jgi:hypothetical protein
MIEDAAAYVAAGAAVVLVLALAWRAWLMRRPTAEEIERRRRRALNEVGKMADGMIVDVLETSIQYSYYARGMEYIAAQDISALQARIPPDRMSVAGPASVKYDPRNPANSIVLCEDWSGLRQLAATRKEME